MRRILGRIAWSAVVGVVVLIGGLCACARDESPPRSAESIEAEFSRSLLEGVSTGSTSLEADARDPETHELIGVRVTTETGLMSAKRAAILVDVAEGVLRLELREVTVAAVGEEVSAENEVRTLDTLMIGPIDIAEVLGP